ncbi:MAG: hypothetical protein AAGI22_04100 [Planctomycetota bacterium]
MLETARPLRKHAPLVLLPLLLGSCSNFVGPIDVGPQDPDGGDVAEGRTLFREGTFGTEGYWTRAVRLPQGLLARAFATIDALDLGLQIDSSRVEPAVLNAIRTELGTDLSPANAPTLHDPAVFQRLLAGHAIVGLVADDVDGNGVVDAAMGDTLGFSCALCHGVVDGSVYDGYDPMMPLTGSIGARVDGPGAVLLDLGALLAVAENSSALYPYLPLSLTSVGGTPISRTGASVNVNATEGDVDALLLDLDDFPVGQVDMLPDGIGAPVTNPSLFDAPSTGPWGVSGEFLDIEDMMSFHVIVGLDATSIVDTPGAAFLNQMAPGIGSQITNETATVLATTSVPVPPGGFPFVDAPFQPVFGDADRPFGRRIDDAALGSLKAYLGSIRYPQGPPGDPVSVERGETIYFAQCFDCHGDPLFPTTLPTIPLDLLRVNYLPTNQLTRGFPYSNMLNDLGTTYDDRVVLFDQIFDDIQVPSLPHEIKARSLGGLFLRGRLLHDGSVDSLDALLDPARGPAASHPFYLSGSARADLIAFLISGL